MWGLLMKYLCIRTCGIYRQGHTYDIERPLPVLAMSAIRAGFLAASPGWCAPSEIAFDQLDSVDVNDGLLSLPEGAIKRGGIRHSVVGESGPEVIVPLPEQPKKVRKPRKKVAEPTTLESLAAETSSGLDDFRGPAAI